ncbi:zinc dependent phospholipase C family protein [Ureibacillus acetophenoni]|nr:zinc dependent phospholipase C family protein [Ureibacillus acetophenoni]
MGSRIMHLIIANRIADRLSIENRTEFLLGGIAPDAVSPKDDSHFYTGDVQEFNRSIDYQGFFHKYRSHIENQYILGYYSHLIADDIWLKGFYLPWLRNRMETNKEIFQQYHNDFRLLNGKLLDYYGFKDDLRKSLSIQPNIIDLDEVKSKDVINFIPYVIGDMDYDSDLVEKEKLNVFTFDQIVGYIETSVDLGLLKLMKLKEFSKGY